MYPNVRWASFYDYITFIIRFYKWGRRQWSGEKVNGKVVEE